MVIQAKYQMQHALERCLSIVTQLHTVVQSGTQGQADQMVTLG